MEKAPVKDESNVSELPVSDDSEQQLIKLKARAFDLLAYKDEITQKVNNELNHIYENINELQKNDKR